MSTTTPEAQTTGSLPNRSARLIRKGIIAGLAGGLAFGSIMAFVGMLPMVGMLIRQENAVVGFLVHMVISAIVGAGFGGVMALYTEQRPMVTIAIGLAYGLFCGCSARCSSCRSCWACPKTSSSSARCRSTA